MSENSYTSILSLFGGCAELRTSPRIHSHWHGTYCAYIVMSPTSKTAGHLVHSLNVIRQE